MCGATSTKSGRGRSYIRKHRQALLRQQHRQALIYSCTDTCSECTVISCRRSWVTCKLLLLSYIAADAWHVCRNAQLSEEAILWAIYSISDNNSYLLFNR
jgi:hypothetical protein